MMLTTVHNDDHCRNCDDTGCHACSGYEANNPWNLRGLDDREPQRDDDTDAYIAHVVDDWTDQLERACEQATADLKGGAYMTDADDVTATVWFVDGPHHEVVCHISMMTQTAHVDAETGRCHQPMLWALDMAGFDVAEDEMITIETRMAAREVRR